MHVAMFLPIEGAENAVSHLYSRNLGPFLCILMLNSWLVCNNIFFDSIALTCRFALRIKAHKYHFIFIICHVKQSVFLPHIQMPAAFAIQEHPLPSRAILGLSSLGPLLRRPRMMAPANSEVQKIRLRQRRGMRDARNPRARRRSGCDDNADFLGQPCRARTSRPPPPSPLLHLSTPRGFSAVWGAFTAIRSIRNELQLKADICFNEFLEFLS